MSGLHLFEVYIRPCGFVTDVIEGVWENLKASMKHQNAHLPPKVAYGFKLIGENRLLTVFEGNMEAILKHLNYAFGDNVEVKCTPLRSYETFAHQVLGVKDSLTLPSHRRLCSGEGHLYWITFTVNYCGMSSAKMLSIWNKEATTLLSLRNQGELELELFKTIGQQQVHLFVRAPNGEVMDDIIFIQPLIKEIGDQVHVKTKAIKCLTI